MLEKGIYCTDIHFGKKANSDTHNQDCLDYLDWFCEKAIEVKADYVAFLGDWNENRSALNISTLNYSYQGAKKLNNLGIPVYFVIGNHDLYHRNSRDVHSVIPFSEFDNFIIIEEPLVVDTIKDSILFCPYLFHDEYPMLKKYNDIPIWAGHFEFRGFVVTGYNVTMPTGPEAKDYHGPKYIFSGHFHKRQAGENIIYIGNTFPMDFGDAGDFERGCMVYDHNNNEIMFKDWDACPKYIKTTLSSLLDNNTVLYDNARVKVDVDVNISFEESMLVQQNFVDNYNLREFIMEESQDIARALTETTIEATDEMQLAGVDDLVVKMLTDIDSDHINNDILVDIYRHLN